MTPPDPGELPLRHALALGLLHGPAELLPISSSAHVALIPWLAGWPYARLDPQLRKSFEVGLHAGTAAALLLRHPLEDPGPAAPGRLPFLTAALLPPATAGYAFHGWIERRLGSPSTIAAGLIVGSLGMVWGEARARRRDARRSAGDASAADGIALGAAQALALVPGVSRSGATFAAARARGFAAGDAERLSSGVGLPLLCGAALLQAVKQLARGLPAPLRPPLAVGAGGAFLSALLTPALLDSERRSKAVLPALLYRMGLAAVVIKKSLTSTADRGGILKATRAQP